MGRISEAVQAYIQAADLVLENAGTSKNQLKIGSRCCACKESLIARTRLAMIYDRIGRKAEAVTEFLAAASLMQRAVTRRKPCRQLNTPCSLSRKILTPNRLSS